MNSYVYPARIDPARVGVASVTLVFRPLGSAYEWRTPYL